MILDNEPTMEIGNHTTVRTTKNMGLAPSLTEVGITQMHRMRLMLSVIMRHQGWRILLSTSQLVDFDQIHLNLNRSRPPRKPAIWDRSMETKAEQTTIITDSRMSDSHKITMISNMTKAWANPSKAADS